MEDYIYKSQYEDDSALCASLNALTQKIWGITVLEGGEADYTPFSMLYDRTVVSNVCVGRFDMVVDGKPLNASMIQTVLTDENHRNKGLVRELFKRVQKYTMESTSATFFTANKDKEVFYRQFGYRSSELLDHYEYIGQLKKSKPEGSLLKLDWNDSEQKQRFIDTANRRAPVSNTFGFINRNWLLFWFCQNFKQDDIYYSPELDAYLLLRIEDRVLKLHDIVAENIPTLSQCLACLDASEIDKVEVYFTPDLLKAEFTPVVDEEGLFFSDQHFPLPESGFCIPDTQRG